VTAAISSAQDRGHSGIVHWKTSSTLDTNEFCATLNNDSIENEETLEMATSAQELDGPLPPKHSSRLSTHLTLEELDALTPEFKDELAKNHGLEVRVISRSPVVEELLNRAGLSASPVEATYDKVYDRTSPGYDRTYDRGA
jgi:hypothetical protein